MGGGGNFITFLGKVQEQIACNVSMSSAAIVFIWWWCNFFFFNDAENCNKDLLEDLIQCLSCFPFFCGAKHGLQWLGWELHSGLLGTGFLPGWAPTYTHCISIRLGSVGTHCLADGGAAVCLMQIINPSGQELGLPSPFPGLSTVLDIIETLKLLVE